jgi:hypothetical protein
MEHRPPVTSVFAASSEATAAGLTRLIPAEVRRPLLGSTFRSPASPGLAPWATATSRLRRWRRSGFAVFKQRRSADAAAQEDPEESRRTEGTRRTPGNPRNSEEPTSLRTDELPGTRGTPRNRGTPTNLRTDELPGTREPRNSEETEELRRTYEPTNSREPRNSEEPPPGPCQSRIAAPCPRFTPPLCLSGS